MITYNNLIINNLIINLSMNLFVYLLCCFIRNDYCLGYLSARAKDRWWKLSFTRPQCKKNLRSITFWITTVAYLLLWYLCLILS